MSQNSARLALGVAFLACAAGVAFHFVRADAARVVSATASISPSGTVYPALVVPKVPEASLGWTRPDSPENGPWAYDLFTPVEVRWDAKSSSYVPKGEVVVAQAPFGLRLVSLQRPRYRYKFGGYVAMPKEADSTVLVSDLVAGSTLRAKIGQTVGPADAKITLLSYDSKTKSLKLKDLASSSEVVVSDKPLTLGDKVIAAFASDEAAGVVWTATAPGEKFENEAGSYVIKGIDFEAQSVTVEKTARPDPVTNKRKTTVETLEPVALPVPAPSPAK